MHNVTQTISSLTILLLLITTVHNRSRSSQHSSSPSSPQQTDNPHHRPVIGVLSQELYDSIVQNTQPSYAQNKSIVGSTFANYIKMSGARVVAISGFREQAYYDDILAKVNGVLFPGGAGYPNYSQVFTRNSKYIFDYAKRQNDKGVHFPLWGTCLGFQLFTYFASNGDSSLLEQVEGQMGFSKTVSVWKDSIIFRSLTGEALEQLKTEKYLFFMHSKAVLTTKFNSTKGLNDSWKIQASTVTGDGKEIVSAMSAKEYPFYAVMFHPQKSIFQWQRSMIYPHYLLSIKVAQELSLMFVEQARKNPNRFSSQAEFARHSIDQCKTVYYEGLEMSYLMEEPDPIDRSKYYTQS